MNVQLKFIKKGILVIFISIYQFFTYYALKTNKDHHFEKLNIYILKSFDQKSKTKENIHLELCSI